MNTAVAAFGMCLGLLLSATAFAAQTDGAPASAPGASPQAIQRRLQRTQAELQRAQTEQLKARVTGLEQRSADNRTELERRDREIAQLQRKLQALSAPAGSAPASGRSR